MSGRDQPFEQSFRQRAGDELAHVASLTDGAVDGGNLGLAICLARLVGGTHAENRAAVAAGFEGK